MIAHKGTQTIHTERLILRKFIVGDAQAMFENWANDERVTCYHTSKPRLENFPIYPITVLLETNGKI